MPMVGLCPPEQDSAPANLTEKVPTRVNKRLEVGETLRIVCETAGREGMCVAVAEPIAR